MHCRRKGGEEREDDVSVDVLSRKEEEYGTAESAAYGCC